MSSERGDLVGEGDRVHRILTRETTMMIHVPLRRKYLGVCQQFVYRRSFNNAITPSPPKSPLSEDVFVREMMRERRVLGERVSGFTEYLLNASSVNLKLTAVLRREIAWWLAPQ